MKVLQSGFVIADVPADQRVEALQAAAVLMTDENRDVLQSLLLFLSDIAKFSDKHQVNYAQSLVSDLTVRLLYSLLLVVCIFIPA